MNLLLLFLAFIPSPDQPLPFLFGKPGPLTPDPRVCADSSHSYDVRFYRLDLDMPMTRAGYTGHELVCIRSNVPALDTFSLDFAYMVCDSVKRAGVPQTFTTPSGLLTVDLAAPLALGDSADIDIFFRRDSTAQQVGYFYCRPPTRIYAHAMTCGCPRDNHGWFPCYDHPSDKAERGIMTNLTVPDTFQTSANGLLDSVTVSFGKRTYWWRHPYPIATYLMTFSASRFVSWSDTVVCQNGDTVPIIHFLWPQDSAPSRTGFQNLPDMIEYYSDTLRYGPYPFERFGFIPGYYGFPWGGMEHQTTVMLHTSYIPGGSDVTQSHELSHMWWGDMITHVGYADVWLNEGFATYAECEYMGHQQGRASFNNLIRARGSSYISRDRQMRFPIYNPPWSQIYDYGHSYCKGAWVEHMLRYVEGDTAWEQPGVFYRALRAYRDSFPYGTVSTDDYQRINEQLTGLDLDWFFSEWVYQAGYPKHHLSWQNEPAGDSFRVITTLAQSNGAQAPDFFRIPLPVRVACPGSDTMVTIRPAANPEVDTFVVAACPESLVVDPDNWVLDSCYITGIAEEKGSGTRGPGPGNVNIEQNPSRGAVRFSVWGIPESGSRLTITDASGRVVRVLSAYGVGREACGVTWDRLDATGRAVPPGVYFCRLNLPNSRRLKLVLAE